MYLFFWQSGNVGAMVSAQLSLPVVALGWRLVVLRRGGVATALLLGVLAWLVCIWSPGIFVGVGIALGWLLNARHWTRRSTRLLFGAGALALLLLSPWLWTTLFPCRAVVEHVGGGAQSESHVRMALTALSQFSRRLQEWHPLILFFGLYAALFRFRRSPRRFLLAVIIPLALLTLSIGWKRQSQLDRVAIPLAAVCILPASIQLGRLFAYRAKGRGTVWVTAGQGVALALLFTGQRIAVAHFGNTAGFKLWPSQASIAEFVEVIQREVPPDARLAFAGMTDCRYEWGKPAFLPILANREMMADDYYGYPKGLINYNYPPKPYRSTHEGIRSFSEAYGITHWAVADDWWRQAFLRAPELFTPVHTMNMQSSTIDLFAVNGVAESSRFHEGSGRVEARENRIDVLPDDPNADRVVIRYNWRDGLVCRTPGAEIAPVPIHDHLIFISVKPNGHARVTIGYRPQWRPLKPNFDGTFHH